MTSTSCPPWRSEWIVFEDDDLLVVDKPSGMATLGDTGDPGDAVMRLRRFFSERGDSPSTLGTHQLLDRETSGLVVLARRKSANPALARQFEGRLVKWTFVAVVELEASSRAWPNEGELRHELAGPKGRGRRASRLRYRVVRRAGRRLTLELSPSTGQTLALRQQLALSGAPIVGDRTHRGASASRLMLHLGELALSHPASGRPVTFRAPAPKALVTAQDGLDPFAFPADDDIPHLVRSAADLRYGLGEQSDAFRLVHDAGDGLPGVTIDRYLDHLVVGLSSDEARRSSEAIVEAAAALGAAGAYLKVRPKHASRIVDARREDIAPREPVRGTPAPDPLPIRELGLPFEARLGDGLSTGLFLDQRENRRRIRELARGARLLNLFCYTATFTAAAAAGGAVSSASVDVSRTVLDWGRRHLDAVGADREHHRLVEADVLGWLDAQVARPERFDLCILDPPSFSTTKKTTFSAAHDYRALAAATIRVLDRGAKLLACTNHRGIVRAKLRRYLHEAARDAKRTAVQMKDLPTQLDFPLPPGGDAQTKCILVTLD